MTDFERVKKAMQMVWTHKSGKIRILESEWDFLAEAAVKAIWLAEKEKGK